MLTAYLNAGFIGLLHEVSSGRRTSLPVFLRYANRFWLRLLGIDVLFLLIALGAGIPLALILRVLGALVVMGVLLVLRVLFIYWEFTVVVEDATVAEGFNWSREHFASRGPELTQVILTILLVNFFAGLLVNLLWSPAVLVFAIFLYGYLATGLQLALMLTFHDVLPESLRDAPAPTA